MKRIASLAIIPLFVGCAAVQTVGGTSAMAPDETFSCYMGMLAEMGYRVEAIEGDSGLIRAVKEDGGQLFGEYANEATITIDADDDGSDVLVTMRRTRMTASAGRSSAGMTMTRDAQEDLSALSAACVS